MQFKTISLLANTTKSQMKCNHVDLIAKIWHDLNEGTKFIAKLAYLTTHTYAFSMIYAYSRKSCTYSTVPYVGAKILLHHSVYLLFSDSVSSPVLLKRDD